MILKLLYCLFFFLLDFLIFYFLVRKILVKEFIARLALLFLVALLSMLFFAPFSIKIEGLGYLMFFSVSIIILHFGFKLMLYIFDVLADNRLQVLFKNNLQPVVDFIRLKLIYIIVFIYQCFYILSH